MQRGRLKQFTIKEYDAWMQKFFYTVIEEDSSGKAILIKSLNNSYRIDLHDCEDAFVEALIMMNIKNMHGWEYYPHDDIVDGWGWSLEVTYDNVSVFSDGWNTYPIEYGSLRQYLEDTWSIPFETKMSKRLLKECRKVKMNDTVTRLTTLI